ncbi:MAG: prepilin-type N-terminal cleavage/methylation domain-containing protein, partial [Mycobacteriales bacterium]
MTASALVKRGRRAGLRRLRPPDDGFSLVEIMVAIVLFALVSSAIVTMLAAALGIGRTNRQRVVAADLASKDLETTRNALKAGVTLPLGKSSTSATVGETTYTVTRTTSWTSLGQSGDACSGGLGIGVAYQRISVAVTWA